MTNIIPVNRDQEPVNGPKRWLKTNKRYVRAEYYSFNDNIYSTFIIIKSNTIIYLGGQHKNV